MHTDCSFWDWLRNFLHKFTWIVLSVHKLNKLGKFWYIYGQLLNIMSSYGWYVWEIFTTISWWLTCIGEGFASFLPKSRGVGVWSPPFPLGSDSPALKHRDPGVLWLRLLSVKSCFEQYTIRAKLMFSEVKDTATTCINHAELSLICGYLLPTNKKRSASFINYRRTSL